ncbi:ATP-grasp domain-containing protein [Antarcticibacterium sp. 1MA-6-2]|uniref:glutathione synthetase n=1 Tax=Antarcticibacterium sp. 1MA-6-2 TaxID=2908210 RepID=UPI001EFF1C16|nr:glutathione synthetase [Antarcticibacterium sp. 1MA-6-2]UJH91722.1 ATP-grasp domain-containing protein [Antarcticibacterium sp. 1MA-6-2]
MKICFVVNSVETETAGTTVYLMHEAFKRKHQVYIMGVGDFNYNNNQELTVHCKTLGKNAKSETPKEYINSLKSKKAKSEKISVKDLDVLFIRNNPTEEEAGRTWAEHSGIAFGRLVQQEGVLVLNDAFALSNAFIDKLYFEELPSSIKPASLITRKKEDILQFFEDHKKKMILKPLEGSGGRGVYLIDKNEKNLNQIIETLTEKGYIIAQEFLPAVKDGDVRVLLLNGKVMEKDGHFGIIRRVSGEGEFRSNISQGASPNSTEYTEEMKKIVEITAPKLIRDGLFFVGLDIVKDKLIEINVLSPGGMDSFPYLGLPNFSDQVIEAIERKLEYKKNYGDKISNRELATMD